MASLANITRRLFLKQAPVVAAAVVTVPAVACETSLTDEELLDQHAAGIRAILKRLHPEADPAVGGYYRAVDGLSGGVIITASVKYIKFAGAGTYECDMPNGTRPIYRVEPYASGYRVCHMWKGKQESPWEYHADLKLIRKIS